MLLSSGLNTEQNDDEGFHLLNIFENRIEMFQICKVESMFAQDIDDAWRWWLDELILENLFEEEGVAGRSCSVDENSGRMTESELDSAQRLWYWSDEWSMKFDSDEEAASLYSGEYMSVPIRWGSYEGITAADMRAMKLR